MLYLIVVCLPGLFTFLLERLMNDVLFADLRWLGFNLIAAVLSIVGSGLNSAAQNYHFNEVWTLRSIGCPIAAKAERL